MNEAPRVRRVADRTIASGTARLRMVTTIPREPTMAAEGSIDFHNRRSRIRLTMPPDLLDDRSQPLEIDTITDGPDVYVPVLELPGRWLRTRLEQHTDDMPAGDPGLLLDWLRGCTSAAAATDSASAESSGLTVLDTVLDLDHAVQAAPEGSRRAVRSWIDQIAPDGTPRSARIWIDTDDLLHRLVLLDPSGGLEVNLAEHGEPVEIDVPGDDAVIDPDELHAALPDVPDPPDVPNPPTMPGPAPWGRQRSQHRDEDDR